MNSNYGVYRTPTFIDVFPTSDDFVAAYNAAAVPATISETNARTLFYLLYARYGNTPIATSDTMRFVFGVWTTIFQYGPAWEQRLAIQSNLKTLALDENALREGALTSFGRGNYSGAELSIDDISADQGVNEYTGQKTKRSALEAYAALSALIETDVTGDFINRFKPLFIKVFVPSDDLVYPIYLTDEN